MKTKFSIGGMLIVLGIVGLLGGSLTIHVGCTSTDPSTGQQVFDPVKTQVAVDLTATVVEDEAVLLMPNKADSDKWVQAIERFRQAADLPALQALLKQLQAGNTTLPAAAATQPSK